MERRYRLNWQFGDTLPPATQTQVSFRPKHESDIAAGYYKIRRGDVHISDHQKGLAILRGTEAERSLCAKRKHISIHFSNLDGEESKVCATFPRSYK